MKAIVFVGPTLKEAEVKRLLPCEVRGPAAQGDVWRALADAPQLLVLLDGVFESRPSVWHREILDALDAGVTVLGAASMGALRAAELEPFGMVGVGEIFQAYRDGTLTDDGEVALLHAGPEHGHRPLTLPLVNVRHAAQQARVRRVLTAAQAASLVAAGQSLFYQERHWPALLQKVEWSASTRARWNRFAREGLEDLKARDARQCLRHARRLPPEPRLALPGAQPSHARRTKLAQRLPGLASLDRSSAPGAGLRTLALAAWARSQGMRVDPAEREAELGRWWAAQRIPVARRAAVLKRRGMDAGDLQRLMELRVLERRALAAAVRLLPDGPASLEGAALEVWEGWRSQ